MKPREFSTLVVTAILASALAGASAQRPPSAPDTGPGGKPPDTVFLEDLTWAETRDLIKGGTTTVIIGTAGTEQKGPHMVDGEHKFVMEYSADKLNELWKGTDARAFWIDDYYTKGHADQNKWITEHVGIPADQIGNHANILDTSELLFVNPKHIRRNRLTGNDYENNGVSGNNQGKSTP